MRGKTYWIFTVVFWACAGLLLLLQALPIDHWFSVRIRFFYLPVIGLLMTSALTLILDSRWFGRARIPLLWTVAFAAVASLVTASILNPITYLIMGLNIAERHLELMSRGMVDFGLFYLLWIVLYLELAGRPLFGNRSVRAAAQQIDVEDRGQPRSIDLGEVECFLASGDYVEIHLRDQSFLKKITISALEHLLDEQKFPRVHRSTIVNSGRVKGVRSCGSGVHELTLASGRVVKASRSYRNVVHALRRQGS